MKNIRNLLSDIYGGSYFLSKIAQPNENGSGMAHMKFIGILFLYYTSLLILFIGILVKIHGPLRLSTLESYIYMFGVYALVYKFIVYPLVNTSVIDEKIDPVAQENMIKKFSTARSGGIILLILSFGAVYLLYKI